MNKYLITALVALLLLGGGTYLYINSQNKKNLSSKEETLPTSPAGHGGGHTSGMSTQPVVQSHRSYEIEVLSNTNNIELDKSIQFRYRIKNDKGEILKDYEIAHEKIMHFIAVRKDLQYFQHLHPDFSQATGEFTVNITFPTDGPYRVFPDFTPGVENPQKIPVTVFHDLSVGDLNKYKAQPVTIDTQTKKTFGNYQITYGLPNNLINQQNITYSLTIEKDGKLVTNLQKYLGALGHSVIIKEGTLDFIHTHADEGNLEFTTSFPDSGVYKIFTQFQHQGNIITTDYVVKVN